MHGYWQPLRAAFDSCRGNLCLALLRVKRQSHWLGCMLSLLHGKTCSEAENI